VWARDPVGSLATVAARLSRNVRMAGLESRSLSFTICDPQPLAGCSAHSEVGRNRVAASLACCADGGVMMPRCTAATVIPKAIPGLMGDQASLIV
jgi:hypothetical protein